METSKKERIHEERIQKEKVQKEISASCSFTKDFLGFTYTSTYDLRIKDSIQSEEECIRMMKRRLWLRGWNPKNCTIEVDELQ